MPPVRILLTGFEPFGGSAVNPSREAVLALAAAPPPDVREGRAALETAILPVIGGAAPGSAAAVLAHALAAQRHDFVVCVGETGSRDMVCVERTAVNRRDYRIADNAGATVRDATVIDDAPAELASTLPVDALVDAVRAAGVRADASTDAGRFLCNEIMFHAISLAHRGGLRGAGFVHVPRLPEQVREAAPHGGGRDRPAPIGMPLEQIVAALHAVVAALVRLPDRGGDRLLDSAV